MNRSCLLLWRNLIEKEIKKKVRRISAATGWWCTTWKHLGHRRNDGYHPVVLPNRFNFLDNIVLNYFHDNIDIELGNFSVMALNGSVDSRWSDKDRRTMERSCGQQCLGNSPVMDGLTEALTCSWQWQRLPLRMYPMSLLDIDWAHCLAYSTRNL